MSERESYSPGEFCWVDVSVGKTVFGMGPTQSDDQPAAWMSYVSVEDAAKAIDTAKEAGGQALTEVIEIPVGKLAALMDDQGAVFSVIEPDYPEPR